MPVLKVVSLGFDESPGMRARGLSLMVSQSDRGPENHKIYFYFKDVTRQLGQGEATFRFYREQERYLSKYSGSIVSDM